VIKGVDRVRDLAYNLKVRFGYIGLCDTCDGDDLFYTKRGVAKFYRLHKSMHRHPVNAVRA
jgi:hypothetical protein